MLPKAGNKHLLLFFKVLIEITYRLLLPHRILRREVKKLTLSPVKSK